MVSSPAVQDPWENIDWNALERLRAGYLAGSAGDSDYWQSDSDLLSYDLTFAQRIGWKWDHALQMLSDSGWSPPGGGVADWGCGTGIAHRAFLRAFPQTHEQPFYLHDRSARAVHYAKNRLLQLHPAATAQQGLPTGAIGTLLISHTLTELSDTQLEPLLDLVSQAKCVLWVEPGTFDVSHRLIRIRDSLIPRFHAVGPCPHSRPCGLSGSTQDWCHFFAEPPPEVFTAPHWAVFGRITGIDVRSLPYSWLALDKRPPSVPADAISTLLGRPRILKAHATIQVCSGCGVKDMTITKRANPDLFRAIKKGRMPVRAQNAAVQTCRQPGS